MEWRNNREEVLIAYSFYSVVLLYFLGTETKLFGDNMKTASDLLKNENAIYLGTLITRLRYIILINGHPVSMLLI